MKDKTKPRIIGFHFISLIVLVFVFVNCKQSNDEPSTYSQKIETDSILSWIAVGRNNSLSIETRKLNLRRAYLSANAQQSDSLKLKYLSKIQWSFIGLMDSTWFRKTNQETNILAHKTGDSVKLANSYWDLGFFHSKMNVNDSAYFNYLKAKKIYTLLGNNLNAGQLELDMASLQADTKNYTSAEVGVIRAIELLKPLEDYNILYRCYNLLGIISKDLGEYEQSLAYYATAKTYVEKSSLKEVLDMQLENNIGVSYQGQGDHVKAIARFKKILSSDSLYYKNPSSYARVLNNLGESQHKLNPNSSKSESLFQKSLQIRDSLGDEFSLAGGYFALSSYYLDKKDTTKALSNVYKAKSFAESSDNNERLLEALSLLTQVDTKNASLYSKRFIKLSDSLQKEERKTRNKFARIQFETDEVVAENQLLARQRQLSTGIAAALLLLGFSGFIIFTQRAKNQKLRYEQAQQATNQEVLNLMLAQSEKVEEGKKMEQKRVSEELHDGVLGKMLGARMMLIGLNKKMNPEAVAERAKAITILQGVEGEIRSISHELSHAAYRKIHNFILSIKDLIETIQNASKINIDLKFTEELDWDALSGEIKINLYRIVQESLQNSVKHAECKNIDLSFYANEVNLIVKIIDNGKGFVQKRGKKGIGMRNMDSRIKKLNGSWDIKSKPGQGTTVSFVIPLVSSDNENNSNNSPKLEHKLQET